MHGAKCARAWSDSSEVISCAWSAAGYPDSASVGAGVIRHTVLFAGQQMSG
jgi:hypothetical protein